MLRLKKILTIFLIISSITLIGCTTVNIKSDTIKAHWIKQGEKAPFSGILLNTYTYYRLEKKASECK